jgi:hypothetical protein
MQDPWNPSADDVRTWARSPDPVEPCEDWDLALSWARHDPAYLELAADDACHARRYLLRVLYLIVGDAVRTGYRTAGRGDIEALLARADAYAHPDIRLWQRRSRDLLAGRVAFDYESWCAGGLASRPDA